MNRGRHDSAISRSFHQRTAPSPSQEWLSLPVLRSTRRDGRTGIWRERLIWFAFGAIVMLVLAHR